ncbi:hypothetical protein D8770_27145 [Methylobacterium sp. DB1607]|nr:hypothetical protein [Methylobacterium sp. DB1607]
MTASMGGDDLEVRARGPATAGQADLRVRAWVLLALDALSRNGLTPISKLRFHRFVYLTNALSPVYRLLAADERIVKYKRGQFYPVLQWHLDRLMGQGLIRISEIRHYVDDDGAWMDAEYRLAPSALPIVDRIIAFDQATELSHYLQEVARAYSAQEDDVLDDLILADLTYADPLRAQGSVIDFSRAEDNLSAQAADSFGRMLDASDLLPPRDRVHLYVDYMDRLRARRRHA